MKKVYFNSTVLSKFSLTQDKPFRPYAILGKILKVTLPIVPNSIKPLFSSFCSSDTQGISAQNCVLHTYSQSCTF